MKTKSTHEPVEQPQPSASRDSVDAAVRHIHPDWKTWSHGWGWTLKLAAGVELHVFKGSMKGDGFGWDGLGRRSKPIFATDEEAKEHAERVARRILATALDTLLPNTSVSYDAERH